MMRGGDGYASTTVNENVVDFELSDGAAADYTASLARSRLESIEVVPSCLDFLICRDNSDVISEMFIV